MTITITILVSEKKRILVADDSETIRALPQTALESAGYEVNTAEDGLSAYELGSAGEYDLIILDQSRDGVAQLADRPPPRRVVRVLQQPG